MNAASTAQLSRSLWPLWILAVVFALPTLAAWFLYLHPQYLPATRVNRGQLLEPQVPINAATGLIRLDGVPFDLSVLEGRWTLVRLESAPCTQACREHLIAQRQIRLALGESRLGVERLLVLTGVGDAASPLPDFAGLHVARVQGAAGDRLLATLGESSRALGRDYVLDPMGRLILRYAPDAPAKDILKDLERLLKASKNWIKGTNYGHS